MVFVPVVPEAMVSEEKVAIAVLGAGVIGPRHARSVLACPGASLHSIVDPDPASANIARGLGVPHLASIDALLASSEQQPAAAIISTPTHLHTTHAQILLAANIPLLIEKPISNSTSSAYSLLETLEKLSNPPPIVVGHHRRFNPYVTLTRSLLAQNKIGQPIALQGTWVTAKPSTYFSSAPWRSDPSQGGGPIMINLVHDVDILQYLFGPITCVQAEKTVSQRENHAAEEGVVMILRFEKGVVGTFICCDNCPSSSGFESGTGENPLIPKTGGQNGAGVFLRVFGTEGNLSVGGKGVRVERPKGGVKSWEVELEDEVIAVDEGIVPFDEQMKHFVKVVRGEETPRCSVNDGIRALKVCEAVREAIEKGCPVDIDPS